MQAEVEVKDRAELRGGEDLGGGAGLENGAFEQDHFVGVLLQGGEIVGGEEDGQVIGLADLIQHVHEQMLAAHVHPGEWLV